MKEQKNIREKDYSIIQKTISITLSSIIALFWIGYLIHLTYNWFHPNPGRFSLDQEKEELLMNDTLSPGHVLISSRSLVNGYGRRTLGRKKDHWSGVETQEQVLAEVTSTTQFVVVFVHGYNTPSVRAVELGERLWNFICEEDSLMFHNVSMYSFLWRGDLDPIEFRSAQRAAKTSARSFAAFVRRLHECYPELPILVVSHSLGARVVLEGLRLLREGEEKQWINNVILIQPAVHVASVSRWKQGGYIFKIWREGEYWEALKSAGYVIATVSDGDKILSKYFSFGQKPTNKPFSSALGSAKNLTEWTEIYKTTDKGTVIFNKRESPVVPFDVSPLGHSEIFEPDSIPEEKLALLWSLALEHLEFSHKDHSE